MARLTHNPTRPDSTFRPLQISTAEITRMREETARIVDNMERNRRAELEQGMANLKAMRENAEYQQLQQQRNFEIEQQNLKAEQLEKQLEAQTAQNQAKANRDAAQQIFGSLAGLSKTAAQATAEIKVENEKRDVMASYISAAVNPDYTKETWYKDKENQLLQSGEIYNSTISQQEALGADPLSSAKARISNPALTHFSNKGNATFILSNQYPIALEAVLNSGITVRYKGQEVEISQARRNPEIMGIAGTFALRTLLKKANLVGLDDQFLMSGLKAANQHLLSQQAQSSKLQLEDTNLQSEDLILNSIRNNVDGLATYGPTGFRQLASLPHLGYAGALDKFESFATERDQDGNFRYSMEELKALDVRGNGRTFAEEWPNRWTSMQEARVKSQIEYDRREFAIDDIAYQKDVDRTMELLSGENNTEANTRATIQYFRDIHPNKPIPSVLTQNLASFTVEAKQKIEAIKKLEAIPDGLITQEAVAAAASLDPTVARALQQRYQAQEARYNSGIYKETAESFKATANGVTSFGTNKPNTPSSVFLQERMKAEYRARVDRAVAGGMDFNQAATTIGQALDAEVKAGARDPNSQWFRKADAPGGAATFPNLNKGALSAVEQANRRFQELKKNIQTNGIETVIGTKGSIITAEEAPVIAQRYGKPGFTVPQDVLAVAGMSNGLDPMVIINRQFQALGLPPLQPPPSLQTTGQTVSPAFRNLLYQTPSPERSTRGLGSTNTFNPTVVPNGLGVMYQQAGQATGVNPAFLAALGEIESTHKADNVSYNGSSFGVMQINRRWHPNFFAQNDWKDPQANINYGAQYYSGLLKKYGDPAAAAMAYNAGPGDYDAYLRGEMPDGPKKTEMINHGKKFTKALYKYGGGGVALNNPALMRDGSQLQSSRMMMIPERALRTFSPQVSSITFDTGQPGIDVFFEDKKFPAVLPGVVKDISFQGGQGKGYGNYVVIESIDPETNEKVDILYSHLASKPNLNPGQTVRLGQIIGQQGGTGRVVSADGTIASIDFLRPAPRGSKDMTPYRNYDSLRRRIASQLRS